MAKSFRTLRRELSEIVRGEELANRIAEKRYDNTSGGGKTFLVGSDGRGLRQIEGLEGFVGWLIWSADGKTLYIRTTTSDGKEPIFVANADGSHPQKFLDA